MPGTLLLRKWVDRREVMQGLWHSIVRLNWLGFARAWTITTGNLYTRRNMADEREISELEMCMYFWPLHICNQHSCSLSPPSTSREPWLYCKLQLCCQLNHSASQIPLQPRWATWSTSGQQDVSRTCWGRPLSNCNLLTSCPLCCKCGHLEQPFFPRKEPQNTRLVSRNSKAARCLMIPSRHCTNAGLLSVSHILFKSPFVGSSLPETKHNY